MEIPDGVYDVLFTVNGDKASGLVLIRDGSVKLVFLARHSLGDPLHPLTWLELDRALLHNSPDEFFWQYEYTGPVDLSKIERIPQRGTFPEPE